MLSLIQAIPQRNFVLIQTLHMSNLQSSCVWKSKSYTLKRHNVIVNFAKGLTTLIQGFDGNNHPRWMFECPCSQTYGCDVDMCDSWTCLASLLTSRPIKRNCLRLPLHRSTNTQEHDEAFTQLYSVSMWCSDISWHRFLAQCLVPSQRGAADHRVYPRFCSHWDLCWSLALSRAQIYLQVLPCVHKNNRVATQQTTPFWCSSAKHPRILTPSPHTCMLSADSHNSSLKLGGLRGLYLTLLDPSTYAIAYIKFPPSWKKSNIKIFIVRSWKSRGLSCRTVVLEISIIGRFDAQRQALWNSLSSPDPRKNHTKDLRRRLAKGQSWLLTRARNRMILQVSPTESMKISPCPIRKTIYPVIPWPQNQCPVTRKLHGSWTEAPWNRGTPKERRQIMINYSHI